MLKIFIALLIAFTSSLLITPLVRRVGIKLGAVDKPGQRKIHTEPVPRIGGLAIVISLFLSVGICKFLLGDIYNVLSWTPQRTFYLAGGLFIFAVGLFDDFRRLGHKVKFLAQILAASLAFYGGVRIESILGFSVAGVYFGLLSWAITVFWFLLFINAINLIDGLDGLAAGITFFAVSVMASISIVQGDYLMGLKFAILSGILLGFLYYNFNPASIFLGDGGSYFIGYVIATFSIIAAVKTTLGTAFLIPLVVLGVPMFDTIFAPIRRFFSGKAIFRADSEHIHHKLFQKGLSYQRVVLILYAVTCVLCAVAIIMIHLRNGWIALFLSLLLVLALFAVKKLGYFEKFFFDRLYVWLRDLTEATRHSTYSGNFLDLQSKIKSSENMDSLWANLCRAFEFMEFDGGELRVTEKADSETKGENTPGTEQMFAWRRKNATDSGMLRIEMLVGAGNPVKAALVLFRNNSLKNVRPFTLRRLDCLQRCMKEALERIYSS
ncbi:MAG TPA: MraY family glycosyltransferase [Smithellaceae bacterium]|nr:MraY family glycosyltransferase [Smithellaceae bacterium]